MARNTLVDEFIRRLGEAERSHEIRELSQLFATDATLVNQTKLSTKAVDAPCDPSTFWSQYLHAFASVKSRFTHVLDNGRTAVLEWVASGTLANGLPIRYSGVSIFEYEGTRITKFRTYYDSAALLPHAPRSEKKYSESVGQPEITNEATS